MVAAVKAIGAIARSNYWLLRPAAAIFTGLRIRFRSDVPARGPGELYPVPGSGRDHDVDSVYLDFCRHRSDLGPPIWFPEGNTGRPCAANLDHGRAHPRRRHRGGPAGHRDVLHLPGSGLPDVVAPVAAPGANVPDTYSCLVYCSGYGAGLRTAGFSGLPISNEFPGVAHLFPLWSIVSTHEYPASDAYYRQPRSAFL